VWLENGRAMMIDQRLLPHVLQIIPISTHEEMAEAIRNMTVRGAPSIGAAAAYGMALAALNGADVNRAADAIRAARPTANDLFYAVEWMLSSLEDGDDPAAAADAYADQVVDACRRIGEFGSALIEDESRIMTHCNAGALATVDIGTALAPIRAAWRDGRKIFVYVSETRPRLQGMKLTAWELRNEEIPHAIIVDGASGAFMRRDTDLVIVGADRIAANGDFANKVGTFDKAVLAKELGVPFYVAAPISTFDFSLESGEGIKIEDRGEEEVTFMDGDLIAPEGSGALNPSFDMSPAKYVTAFITEHGVFQPSELRRLRKEQEDEEGRP